MSRPVDPHEGKTINRRAGCGRTARPVRRGAGPKPIGPAYPYKTGPGGLRRSAKNRAGRLTPLR
jgi:hypothetical protein